MAIAKGANLPPERMLDAIAHTDLACKLFEQWADVKASKLEVGQLDVVDDAQVRLAAWQADRFGNVPTSDIHMAMGVIEELGEAFDEDAGPEESVDALGDVCVYSAQLCTANRLAVRPVIELAALYCKDGRCGQLPPVIMGNLAHVVLKHAQNIRGLGPSTAYLPRLVDALAMMIAKALEDAIIGHELIIDPAGVFVTIANEVMQRKAGDAMIPTPTLSARIMGDDGKMHDVPLDDHREQKIRADALERLHGGAAMLEKPEVKAEGDFTAPKFVRLTSEHRTDDTPIHDPVRNVWVESDQQLAARIEQIRRDLEQQP